MSFQKISSAQQISLVHRQGVAFQEFPIFRFERNLCVVGPLLGDIGKRVTDVRLADRKRAVSILPGKAFHLRPLRRYPFGGFALQTSNELADGSGGNQANKQVHVVLDTTDLKGFEIMGTADASQVTPDFLLDVRSDPALPIFRGKYNVQVNASVGVSHDGRLTDRSPMSQALNSEIVIHSATERSQTFCGGFIADSASSVTERSPTNRDGFIAKPVSSTAERSRTIAVGFSPRSLQKQSLWRSHNGFAFIGGANTNDVNPVSLCDTKRRSHSIRGLKPTATFLDRSAVGMGKSMMRPKAIQLRSFTGENGEGSSKILTPDDGSLMRREFLNAPIPGPIARESFNTLTSTPPISLAAPISSTPPISSAPPVSSTPPISSTAERSRTIAVGFSPRSLQKQSLWRSHNGFAFIGGANTNDINPVSLCDTKRRSHSIRGLKPTATFLDRSAVGMEPSACLGALSPLICPIHN
jgi:hypothetical protein